MTGSALRTHFRERRRWTLLIYSYCIGSLSPLGGGSEGGKKKLLRRVGADDGKGVLASCLRERTRRELHQLTPG